MQLSMFGLLKFVSSYAVSPKKKLCNRGVNLKKFAPFIVLSAGSFFKKSCEKFTNNVEEIEFINHRAILGPNFRFKK